jgi:hypothetical protein
MMNIIYQQKKHYRFLFFGVLSFFLSFSLTAQDVEKCGTVPYELSRLGDNYELYLQAFEEYINRQGEDLSESNTVYRIPVVMHVIHDNDAVGSGANLSKQVLDAQIEQINNDFRKVLGSSGDGNGVDTRIEFCAATVDENGMMLAEPGINRINRVSAGWTAPPYDDPGFLCFFFSTDYINNTVKPESIWDPEQYLNIWILEMECLLGFAQFPEAPGLPGIGTGNGGANTDGVVVSSISVGSTDVPNPASSVYDRGRTLSHEIGHWLGLRHIWGDGDCTQDDFCADTPVANGSTRGCPSGKDSCPNSPGLDQIENYMDYSDDLCMNIFTADQRARMEIVMGGTGNGSPRREILASSAACGGGGGAPSALNLNGNPVPVDQYCAINSIQSSGSVNTSGNQQMVFQAGSFVQLNPGFSTNVSGNSTFVARIGACNNAQRVEERTEETTIVPMTASTTIAVFPNPFQTQTQIQLDLAIASQVRIELMDMTGRRIKTLVASQQHSAGRHNVYLEGAELKNGMYILLININDKVQAQKISVIK